MPPLDPVIPPTRTRRSAPATRCSACARSSSIRGIRTSSTPPHGTTPFIARRRRSRTETRRSSRSSRSSGAGRFQDLAMFDLTGRSAGTRAIYVYNGTRGQSDAGAVPARQRGRAGSDAGDRQRRESRQHDGVDRRCRPTTPRNPASTSRSICASQCFYDLVVAVPQGGPTPW